jgi:hypothetical protein
MRKVNSLSQLLAEINLYKKLPRVNNYFLMELTQETAFLVPAPGGRAIFYPPLFSPRDGGRLMGGDQRKRRRHSDRQNGTKMGTVLFLFCLGNLNEGTIEKPRAQKNRTVPIFFDPVGVLLGLWYKKIEKPKKYRRIVP